MSLTVDRKRFWERYRAGFGESPQATVDGLNYFLDRFENEDRLHGIPQYSYVLSTAFHESGKNQIIDGEKVFVRFQPVKESRERSDSPRRANQDRYWKTGFYGRGFPQTTWERNYLKSGQALGLGDKFVKDPDLLLVPKYAYDAMIICMVQGIYTGKKLSDYISDTGKDYKNARKIINGTDKAGLIAGYASQFEEILRASKTNSAVAVPPPKTLEIEHPEVPTDAAATDITVDNVEKLEVNNTPPPSTTPVMVTSETPSIWAKVGAAIAAITGIGIQFGNIVTTKLTEMTPVQLGYVIGGLAIIGIGLWLYDRSAKRAHEKTLAKMQTASDPAKNTVTLKG